VIFAKSEAVILNKVKDPVKAAEFFAKFTLSEVEGLRMTSNFGGI